MTFIFMSYSWLHPDNREEPYQRKKEELSSLITNLTSSEAILIAMKEP